MGADMTIAITRYPHTTDNHPVDPIQHWPKMRATATARLDALTAEDPDLLTTIASDYGLATEDEHGAWNPDPARVLAHLDEFLDWFKPDTITRRDGTTAPFVAFPRDVTTLYIDEHKTWYLASGGLSWGDPPTDAYEVILTVDALGLFNEPIDPTRCLTLHRHDDQPTWLCNLPHAHPGDCSPTP